ncbi:MAG: SpoIID/LytB domain-containing protein [Magnetococcales bacterium]|nr:SpoIID/LytB domain-containing protein [Magnetococcales bacterium]
MVTPLASFGQTVSLVKHNLKSDAVYFEDVGQYLEALVAYDHMYRFNEVPEKKVRALMERARILAVYLDAPEASRKVYQKIRREFPSRAGQAWYAEGRLLVEMERWNDAQTLLSEYRKQLPNDLYAFHAQYLMTVAEQRRSKANNTPVTGVVSNNAPSSEQKPEKQSVDASKKKTTDEPISQQTKTPIENSKEAVKQQETITEKAVIIPPDIDSVSDGDALVESGLPDIDSVPDDVPLPIPLPKRRLPHVQPNSDVIVPSVPTDAAAKEGAGGPAVKDQKAFYYQMSEVEEPTVRILLLRKSPLLQLVAKGLQFYQNGELVWQGTQAVVKVIHGRLVLTGGWQYPNEPAPAWAGPIQVKAEEPIRVVSGSGNRKSVRGTVWLAVRDERIRVINHVGIESYLRGVMPVSSQGSWPAEALKAQAIAARTFAYFQIRHRIHLEYDMVDQHGEQGYGGVGREVAPADAAVAETRGRILVLTQGVGAGMPIYAKSTTNNGGRSADSGDLFTFSLPYLVFQNDPWSEKGKMVSWQRRYALADVGQYLVNRGVVGAEELVGFRSDRVSRSGRMLTATAVMKGRKTTVPTQFFLMGDLKLPSMLTTVQDKGEYVVFQGYGFGHGLGYSKWGGVVMAKVLKSVFGRILAFYYPGTSLAQAWH